jgi:hypothetical protein
MLAGEKISLEILSIPCISETETTDKLTAEDDASDLCSAKVESLEAVIVAGPDAKLLFEVVGVDDLSESVLGIKLGILVLETANRALRLLEIVLSDQVVW